MEETFHTGKLWKEVSGYLSQTYEAGELEKIWVHGDGGGRIQNGLEEFAQTRHVMDGFHWERELKRFSRKFPKKNVKQRIRQVIHMLGENRGWLH